MRGVGLVAALLNIGGDAEDVGPPVVGEGVEGGVGQASGVPLGAVGAHAAELDGDAVLVAELGAADLEAAVGVDGGGCAVGDRHVRTVAGGAGRGGGEGGGQEEEQGAGEGGEEDGGAGSRFRTRFRFRAG